MLGHSADRAMRYAWFVFAVIAVGSALTLVVAFVLRQVDPELVNWVVWVRAGFYTVGGLWLMTLVRAARRSADRAAFVRMRIISVLAPLGILALVISPDSGYPVWMKVEQAVFGVLIAPLAFLLFTRSVAADFAKPSRKS